MPPPSPEGLCGTSLALRRSQPSPLAGILHDEGADDAGGEADAAEDGDAEEPLLGDLVVDELAQVGGLQVGGLLVEEQVVVAAGLAVVAELVVAEGEVVQALAAALGGDAKDFGQEADAELLVAAVVGLDEALESRSVRERESRMGNACGLGAGAKAKEGTYPGVVELCLHAYHVALLFVLRAENLELCGVERPVTDCSLLAFWQNVHDYRDRPKGVGVETDVSASRASAI